MAHSTAYIDLEAIEGATFERRFIWKSGPVKTAQPVDLTGYTAECHIRDRVTEIDTVFILKDGEGVIIEDQEENTGAYRLYIPHTESKGKCIDHRTRKMDYDLRLVSPDGYVRMQQSGKFTLQPAVTRPWTIQE